MVSAYYWFDDDVDVAVNDVMEGLLPGWFTLFPVEGDGIAPIRLELATLPEYQKDALVKLVDDLIYGAEWHVERLRETAQYLKDELG